MAGFTPGLALTSLAVVAPLLVPFGVSVLLLFNGRFFVEGTVFGLIAAGGVETCGLVEGLTVSVFGLFANTAGLIIDGLDILLLVDGVWATFLGTSVFSAGFLGYIFDAVVAVVLVESFFYRLGTFESFLLITRIIILSIKETY